MPSSHTDALTPPHALLTHTQTHTHRLSLVDTHTDSHTQTHSLVDTDTHRHTELCGHAHTRLTHTQTHTVSWIHTHTRLTHTQTHSLVDTHTHTVSWTRRHTHQQSPPWGTVAVRASPLSAAPALVTCPPATGDRLLTPVAAGATSAGVAGCSLFVCGCPGNGDGPTWSRQGP